MKSIFNAASTIGAGFSSPETSPVMTEFMVLAGAAVVIGASTLSPLMAVGGLAALGVGARQLYVNGDKLMSPPAPPAP